MSDRDASSRGTRVYVGGLTDAVKKEDLESEFEKYGKLSSVWVAFNPPGFAFVEFASHDDAETACDNLNGTDFLGSKLRVEIARGRGRRGGGGGGPGGSSRGFRGGGGFRGGRYESDFGERRSSGGGGGDDGYRREYRPRGGGGSEGHRRDSYRGRGGEGRYEQNGRFRSRSPTRR